MDQLESMSKIKSILDDSIVEHKSLPPLRWIANLAGSIASKGLLEVSYMQEENYFGWKYKFNVFLWDKLWPVYEKYGTSYRLRMDLSGKNWDDYDENGIPYWEKAGFADPDFNEWDFEDLETGDAFRVLK